MAFINSMAKREKFKRFEEYLRNGNVEGVKENLEPEFVDKIVDCHTLDMRPIHKACENGHYEIVNLLIENKCNIESENIWEWRPIHFACEKGHFDIVNLLIEKKCNIESETKEGWRPIHLVCINRHFKIVNLLIEKKCKIESENKSGISPIHLSCLNGSKEIVNLLIEYKCNIESEDNYGIRPIHSACEKGHIEIVNLLIEYKCNIESETKDGMRPIHFACLKGSKEIVKLLIAHNCLLNVSDEIGQTPLDKAKSMGHKEIVKLLSEFEKVTKQFHQPLAEKKDITILKESLQLSQRENSLTLCVKMNRTIYPCFLKSLDRNKANSSDDERNSLLHLSAKLMNFDLCKALLQAGASIDSLNKKENTSLFELLSDVDQQSFISNEDKIIETVNLFVQSGCDLNKGLKGDLSLIQIIRKFNSERLLLALLPRQQNQLFEIDENLLKIALHRNFYQFCESLFNLFPKEYLKSSISTFVIEEALKHDCTQLLKSLVLNASDDVQQVVLEFSLYHLAKEGDNDSFECLLNIEIKNPLCFGDGESLLTKLLIEEKFCFCQRIIKSKVNKKYIKFKNEKNQTPLQVAIETDSLDVILNDLVLETCVIDNMDCEGRTALMQLFIKISNNTEEDRHSRLMNVIKAIICKGGNIYHKTSNGKKAIEFCCSSLVREETETFQNNKNNVTNPVRGKIIVMENVVVVKEPANERKTCGVCLDREVDSVFECGHTICEVCGSKLFRCPFCNFEPARPKRIYFN